MIDPTGLPAPLTRHERLAAEVFAIPYHEYAERVQRSHPAAGPGMLEWIAILETAEEQRWEDRRVASLLGCEVDDARDTRRRYRDALEIIDARTPVEGFHIALRQAVATALSHRGLSEMEIDDVVALMGARVADLLHQAAHSGRPPGEWMRDLTRPPF